MYLNELDVYRQSVEKNTMQKSNIQREKNTKTFKESIGEAEKRKVRSEMTPKEMEEDLKRLDTALKRIKEENKREQERRQKLRIKKRRLQKKIMEKLVLKKYLARQDELQQLNEKVSLERMTGEDVYIEKPPLSKSLSVAEIMALCSDNL